MNDTNAKTVYLKDYKPSDYKILDIYLTFDLHSTETLVSSKIKIKKNSNEAKNPPLVLNGEELELISVAIDGKKLSSSEYDLQKETLTILNPPSDFTLEIINKNNPEANKALDGLYKSGSMFCTQNEPEGFRRITYYIDRPDVMATFTTKVIANKKEYPILLSNGNPVERGDLPNGKHFVEWKDPFKKPSYLFALVAGDLGVVKDHFVTKSGRKIDLEIYCDKGNEGKCSHAMVSLQKSMKWDEDTFGREYDLDIYMIVAVDSFNMGAMENKGLNIFNSAYVLADPTTATDQNFEAIEGVIAHEYFHNWTGNRITCRDWFQLTLKEGLTVYRDQEFSADMNVRSVLRIQDVNRLRTAQFAEDGGPTAHPIKPDRYMEINNFYTMTVYEKGAEVIRMIATMLGKSGFRKGMDKYFELFDGGAVTTEDFIHAMSVANNNYDFEQFKRWYSQAGTPVLNFKFDYNEKAHEFTLNVSQSCPKTPGQDHKEPFHLPLALGLIGQDGKEIALNLVNATNQPQIKDGILHIRKSEESFTFKSISGRPVVSLNRGFSAPVKIVAPYTLADLAYIMAYDKDGFNRVDACQELARQVINNLIGDMTNGKRPAIDRKFVEAFGIALKDKSLDDATKALTLQLPAEELIKQDHNPIYFNHIFNARKLIKEEIARSYKNELMALYKDLAKSEKYSLDSDSVGKRDLKKVVLDYLMNLKDPSVEKDAYSLFKNADNMTDELSALALLVHYNCHDASAASLAFYKKWKHEGLVMQKWLAIWARAPLDSTFERVIELEADPIYDSTVPNFVRSLLVMFATNLKEFHHESGRAYRYITDKTIEYDKMNPQVASRLAQSFNDYKRLPANFQAMMKGELQRIKNSPGLSKNVTEIVTKILEG